MSLLASPFSEWRFWITLQCDAVVANRNKSQFKTFSAQKKVFAKNFLKFFFERATKIIFEAAISFLTFAFLVFFSCLEIVAKWFSWQRFGFLFHRCLSLLRSKKSPEQGQTFLLPDSGETCSRRISFELGRSLCNEKVWDPQPLYVYLLNLLCDHESRGQRDDLNQIVYYSEWR